MKHLEKPELCTKDIVLTCADSYRVETRDGLKNKLIAAADLIHDESGRYHEAMSNGELSYFTPQNIVNGNISTGDMCDTYDNKFVKNASIRNKYYNKIMACATTGKCPICGIGQVSNLDHYLAKTLYPVYAITPYNLTPVCRDCNFSKLDSDINTECAPFHPYYDEIDSDEWLKARLIVTNGSFAAEYFVNPDLLRNNEQLYNRLVLHMGMYALAKAYAIQAATEISENSYMWKRKLNEWGENAFREYLCDCLISKEKSQRNTWNTALLRALIMNVGIIDQLEDS